VHFMERPSLRTLIRSLIIELIVYAVLLVGYFLLVLRFLAAPLARLFSDNLTLYGIASLALIVTQGVTLEALTSWLMRVLKLDRLL
jgi:hypothetical protein